LNKRLVVILVAAAVIIVLIFVMAFRAGRPQSARPENNIKKYIDSAEKSMEEGDLLKAKELYSAVMEKHPDSKVIKAAQDSLEKLNMELLFSPAITEDSVVYTVEEGDTLGKIAKKFNTTVQLLTKANGLKSDLIHPGKRLKVSTARYSIIVDKSQNILTLKSGDSALKVYTVSTGADNSTPVGKFKIVNKLIDPTWYKAGAVVPSGSPENILGSRWMGITVPGYGIHGTTEPDSIGKSITAGCIRMLNNDVEELYAIVPVGTDVVVVD
jgi:lipoprotein-anchoring transpeptidase ErfK/SrfK